MLAQAQSLEAGGQLDAALLCYQRLFALNPMDVMVLLGLANILHKVGRKKDALAWYTQILAIDPGLAEIYCNRGNVLGDLQRYDEALADYDRAVTLAPALSAAWSNRGNALKKLGRLAEALQSYAQAVKLKPENAKAQLNVAMAHLVLGNFAQGWPLYEWRWKDGLKHRLRHYPQPLWLGEADVSGKTVLIYREQGFGDTLQFCRYAQLLAQRGARVVLEVQEPLFALLQGLPGVAQLIKSGDTLPAFDLHCPLLSLPLAFATHEHTIPALVPYVHADAAKAAHWQTRLPVTHQRRIGLVCSGSPTHGNDANRSLSLAQLLDAVPEGWQCVCLHKVLRKEDARTLQQQPKVLFVGDALHDFSDTAALIACLDVVLTVDTSVAHLAAAMGKPTWILLPFAPDWRWMLDRTDSPWYPSVRLFRQHASADWGGALAQVRGALLQVEREASVSLNGGAVAMTHTTSKSFAPFAASVLQQAQQLYVAQRYRECLTSLQPLLARTPETIATALQVWRMAGACLFSLDQPLQAARMFEQVTRHAVESPGSTGKQVADAQDWLNLASALDEAKQYPQAEVAYAQVLQRKPTYIQARLQWCALLRTLGRQEQAQAELELALAELPVSAPVSERAMLLHAQGVVAHELGGYVAAKPLMLAALAQDPDLYEARYHLAMGALAEGDNASGWEGFEWRWGLSQASKAWRNFGEGPLTPADLKAQSWAGVPTAAARLHSPVPLWRGEPVGEASLLVWEEQGLGDGLQFFRYLVLLREREPRATLLFWCRRTLHPVFAAWAQQHGLKLLSAEQLRPEQVRGQEWHVPLMSLPFCLRESGYPPVAGTVSAPPDRLARWQGHLERYALPTLVKGKGKPARSKVSNAAALRQVGLVWSGTQVQTMSTRRNLELQKLSSWLEVPGVQWHSLQVGECARDIALSDWQGRVVDWSHHLKDFGDTAALIEQLDLVITVDTSTAHLAASLGKPTWLLSRYDACWRWLLARDDSPWYPSLRLFRQTKPFDWASVIEKVKEALNGNTP